MVYFTPLLAARRAWATRAASYWPSFSACSASLISSARWLGLSFGGLGRRFASLTSERSEVVMPCAFLAFACVPAWRASMLHGLRGRPLAEDRSGRVAWRFSAGSPWPVCWASTCREWRCSFVPVLPFPDFGTPFTGGLYIRFRANKALDVDLGAACGVRY